MAKAVADVTNGILLIEVENNLQKLRFLAERGDVQQRKISEEVIEAICQSDPTDKSLAGSIAAWLTETLSQQNQPIDLEKSNLDSLILWLGKAKEFEVVSALYAIRVLLKTQTHQGAYWEIFHPKCSKILRCLGTQNDENWKGEELVLATVQCLDTLLARYMDPSQLTEEQKAVFEAAADAVIRLHYVRRPTFKVKTRLNLFLLSSLALTSKVCALCPSYARAHISELFGLAISYLQYGICGSNAEMVATPLKVYPSQQATYRNEGEMLDTSGGAKSCGGKVSKARKLRTVAKGSRQTDAKMSNTQHIADDTIGMLQITNLDIEASDSDVSETEGAVSRDSQERHRHIKIRIAAITLLSAVIRAEERHTLYGYWHILFSNASRDGGLLSVGLHDSAIRCRSSALQVAAQVIYGSRNFLNQAESSEKSCSAAFIPFSHGLGLMVMEMYDILTTILSTESSLPVIIQSLKCLAVLVQATPFQKLDNGFVSRFVELVRPMIYHSDSSIQVSALMVLEFLLVTPELTPEIAKVFGLSPKTTKLGKHCSLPDDVADFIEVECLEHELQENSEIMETDLAVDAKVPAKDKESSINEVDNNSSWLLLCVLDNLISSKDEAACNYKSISNSVRIESLQVLSSMATHFELLRGNLPRVGLALHHCLQPALPVDVRLYAARCLDICAYQMGQHLLNNLDDFRYCERFWMQMLPVVMEHVHNTQDQASALKVCLCDALSNIGVVVFERLPYSTQMQLLSFLSGISNDALCVEVMLRATAARALAVYVSFPSLRGNLVVVENTAEIILRLMEDTNLLVRVKALWSLGNISDAMQLSNVDVSASTIQEHISDDLLRRLLDATIAACNDNDKVRCNAVRALGNLLQLLRDNHFKSHSYRIVVQKSMSKLADCIRSPGSAKVKWNSCYAIGNLMQHDIMLTATSIYQEELNWQSSVYSALCHVIVHHSNFKVRINAATAIANIKKRAYFGSYFEKFWSTLLIAIEQSMRLDNFCEYNHRDHLQEQLCLAVCNVINCSLPEDFIVMKKHLTERLELVRNIWTRVTNRMVPEQVAPLLACSFVLQTRVKDNIPLIPEQKTAITFIANAFTCQ